MDVVLFRVFLQPYICHHQSQVYPLTNRVTKWFHPNPSSPHCWSSSYLEVPPAPTRCNPTRRSWGWRTRYSPRSILIWRWGLWETDPSLSLVCGEMRACCPQVECKCKSGQVEEGTAWEYVMHTDLHHIHIYHSALTTGQNSASFEFIRITNRNN